MTLTKFSFANKYCCSQLFSLCLISASLVISNRALADYKKPTNPSYPNPDNITTTTTRGLCSANSNNENKIEAVLTALAPYSHRGQTVSSHPTFVWFVPETEPFPVEFQLHEYDEDGNRTLIYQKEFTTTPGIMQLSLPLEQSGLLVGKAYRWQVAILCDRNHPSKDIIVRTELEVVALQSNLSAALSTVNNPLEKADVYAEYGLWYDALAMALSAPANTSRRDLIVNLLTQLANLEKEDSNELGQEQSTRLEQVIENIEFGSK